MLAKKTKRTKQTKYNQPFFNKQTQENTKDTKNPRPSLWNLNIHLKWEWGCPGVNSHMGMMLC